MKKYLLTILLLLICSTKTYASVEGRMFLEMIGDSDSNVAFSLEKVLKRNIKEENIREAYLNTNEVLDITDDLKEALREENEILELEIDDIFCEEKCKSNEYPFVKILYSFNNPPEILLLSPKNDFVTEPDEIFFEWKGKDNDGKFLEYSFEIYEGGELIEKSDWSNKSYHRKNLGDGFYSWKVLTRDNSFLKNIVVSETFSLEVKKRELILPISMDIQEEEEEEKVVEVEEEKEEIIYKKPDLEVDDDVLGIGSSGQPTNPLQIPNPSVCIYKYNSTHKRIENRKCNINPPRIVKVQNFTKDNHSYIVNTVGYYNPDILILVDEYRCTLPIFCGEKFVKRTRMLASPYTAIATYMNEKFTSMNEFRRVNKYFFTSHLLEKTNPFGKRVNLKYHLSHSFSYDGKWINMNFTSPYSNTRAIPPAQKIVSKNSTKIYRFPFSKNIGVTQWHGYTAFQSPHTGVDFGSYKEPIYAIGDGIVREAKWDNYSGTCLSGGYFLRVEHSNGMNSVYLHLENYRKKNGQSWKVGEKIKKGELLGISGNTGAYNCQPLGYHLHFELRKNNLQRNHVNPVPYINVNWDNIPTLNHTKIPGRLTGNNPHPKW